MGEEGSRAPASSPACHGTKDPHQEHPGGYQMVGTGQVLRDPKRACLLWDQLSSALLLRGRTVSPVPRKDSSQPSVSTLPDCRSRMRVKRRHFQTHESRECSPHVCSLAAARGHSPPRRQEVPRRCLGHGRETLPRRCVPAPSQHHRLGPCQPKEFILPALEAGSPRSASSTVGEGQPLPCFIVGRLLALSSMVEGGDEGALWVPYEAQSPS